MPHLNLVLPIVVNAVEDPEVPAEVKPQLVMLVRSLMQVQSFVWK